MSLECFWVNCVQAVQSDMDIAGECGPCSPQNQRPRQSLSISSPLTHPQQPCIYRQQKLWDHLWTITRRFMYSYKIRGVCYILLPILSFTNLLNEKQKGLCICDGDSFNISVH